MRVDPLDVGLLLEEVEADDHPWNGLPPGTTIGHVHLKVANLEEASSFYHNVLGFDIMQRYGRRALFLSAGGYHHHLGLNTWAGEGAPPPSPDTVGLRHFVIRLPARDAYDRVLNRLRQTGNVVEETDDGILVRDPSENALLLTWSHKRQ